MITFSPLNHRQCCVVVPPFPCPLTGHSLSVGYTASSHTKVPLKYQFVYSSVLNMLCAVSEMSDSLRGKAASVLMALASVIFSFILLFLQLYSMCFHANLLCWYSIFNTVPYFLLFQLSVSCVSIWESLRVTPPITHLFICKTLFAFFLGLQVSTFKINSLYVLFSTLCNRDWIVHAKISKSKIHSH